MRKEAMPARDGLWSRLTLMALGAAAVALLPTAARAQGAPEPPPPNGGYAAPEYGPPPGGYAAPQGYGTPPPGYPPPGYGPPPGGYPPPRYRYGYGRPVVYMPAPHAHDGFYLNLHLGGGFTSISSSYAGDKYTFSGGSVSFGFAAGGVIAPNLILFGTFYLNTIQDPTFTRDGIDQGSGGGTTANLFGLGIGVAYYLMPVNVYFSAALSASWLELDDSNSNDTLFQTNTGVGFQGMVGKEWWITQDWGIGVAGELTLATMKDSDYSDARWNGGSFSIVFSATYN